MIDLISTAYAQDAAGAAAAAEPSLLVQLAPLLIVFVIFYLIVIRPQSKRIKAHHAMLNTLNKGDKIVTGGGVQGTVKKVDEETALVEIANGVEIRVLKDTISAKSEDIPPIEQDNKTSESKSKNKKKKSKK